MSWPRRRRRRRLRWSSRSASDGREHVRGRVVELAGGRATLEFPAVTNDVPLSVSSLFAGEWADSSAFECCRLVAVEWPDRFLPGPAFDAPDRVLIGAIVKPSLGLTPAEVAQTAARLVAAGADLVKDDELLGDPDWCRLDERVRAVAAAGVNYAATSPAGRDVAGARETRRRARRAPMINGLRRGSTLCVRCATLTSACRSSSTASVLRSGRARKGSAWRLGHRRADAVCAVLTTSRLDPSAAPSTTRPTTSARRSMRATGRSRARAGRSP